MNLRSNLRIWDATNGRARAILKGHAGGVYGCDISPDGTYVVSASADKTLKVWDVVTGELRLDLTGHTDKVYGCAISPDSTYIVSWSADHTVKLWDATTGKPRATAWESMRGKRQATLKGHIDLIVSCAISPDSSFIVSASRDKTLKIWDAATGNEKFTLIGHGDRITAFAISPDASFIVSASYDNNLKIWDTSTGKERGTLSGHTDRVFECAISPDSSLVVSASKDTTLKLWELESGEEQATLAGHTAGVSKVAISPDGTFIVSASSDKTLILWDVYSELNKDPEAEQVQPVETIKQSLEEKDTEILEDDRLPSEIINNLFERRQIDPTGKKILAVALLYEREMAPYVWVGPGPDPYAVGTESREITQLRYLMSKVIPSFQPHFIPGHLGIDPGTLITGRPFEIGESLDVGYINPMLAVMLADLLEDAGALENVDLGKCSALCVSGNSVALGEARLALVVSKN